ncbi:MAG: SDR family NAD(P)-dependent oxidoreductase, partial [Pseudomonadota bacterium]|nr:SDR family NAD(P)-dependent oxidoreductase [Pseudomonadota bacterium]
MSARQAVIITGGAKRIGAALARDFARHGYDIALHYNHSENEARTLQKELGAGCRIFAQDLADSAGIAPLMQRIQAEMPHCTALI